MISVTCLPGPRNHFVNCFERRGPQRMLYQGYTMDDQLFFQELTDAAEAIGRISDEERFRGLFDAFRAGDRDSYQHLLEKLQISNRCELVCSWFRSKECVLLCYELCGPPQRFDLPDPREFAHLLVKLASNEEFLKRLAATVEKRDGKAFRELLSKFQLERYCRLICHWVCIVHTRLRCRIVCGPRLIAPNYLAEELVASASALGRLLEHGDAFDEVFKATAAGNCEEVRGVLLKAGLNNLCSWICEWFCSWRCVEVCSRLCLPLEGDFKAPDLKEAYEFAQFTGKLSAQPELLSKLAVAVATQNADQFAELVKKLEAVRFCQQICHWICSRYCAWMCRCVCTPGLPPLFTNIGFFNIYADIAAGSGLTNKGLGYSELAHHGGPGFAFMGNIELRGYCPIESPLDGSPMRYRFLVTPSGTPVTGSHVNPVQLGQRRIAWPDNSGGIAAATSSLQSQSLVVKGASVADTPPPAVGDPWFGPVEHVITPDPDGWVAVDPASISGGFTTLMGFNTNAEVPGGNPNPGVAAGQPVPAANVKNGTTIGLTFEATRISGPASPPDYTNSVDAVRINNWIAINQINIAQFIGSPTLACTPITSDLNVLYTADHELMASWSAVITSASLPSTGIVIDSGAMPRGNVDNVHYDTSTWAICSYVAQLTTRAARTTGLEDEEGRRNPLTFCVGRKNKIN